MAGILETWKHGNQETDKLVVASWQRLIIIIIILLYFNIVKKHWNITILELSRNYVMSWSDIELSWKLHLPEQMLRIFTYKWECRYNVIKSFYLSLTSPAHNSFCCVTNTVKFLSSQTCHHYCAINCWILKKRHDITHYLHWPWQELLPDPHKYYIARKAMHSSLH